jgi:hypothetical protein
MPAARITGAVSARAAVHQDLCTIGLKEPSASKWPEARLQIAQRGEAGVWRFLQYERLIESGKPRVIGQSDPQTGPSPFFRRIA